MEEKKVILYVRGEQYFEDVDPEATELISEGVMTISDGGVITLVYDETELTGLEGTTTTFVIDGGMVTLTRSGELNSQMIFQMGKRHTSLYETPFGELSIDIQTSRLRHNLTEQGGIMDLRYSISVEHAAAGRNAFKIRVRRRHEDRL